jgi:hypothetical protein
MDLRSLRLVSVARVLATASAIALGACSTTSSPAPDGSGGGAGSGAGGATASCSNVVPCGGSVVGTWNVTSSCLTISGEQDLTLAGLNCAPAPITGSLHVTGTWTANADGTYADGTTTTGTEQFQLAPACLMLSGTTTTCDGIGGPLQGLGFQSVTCTPAGNGGCTCTATVNQMGGAGLVSVLASGSGNYATSGNTLTVDSNSPYSYCVSGSKMTWTPQPTSPTTTGTIVFQGTGATGSGGTSGMGGSTATGGTSGMGGRGAGGTTGQGGSATGGRSGAGGATAGAGGSTATAQGPCDIYAAAGTPCVAAYSTARLLSRAYTGPLYQVRKGGTMTSDGTGANMKTGVRAGGTTMDIGMVAGGFADSAAQDTFCGTDPCTFSVIYDQSGKGNHLRVAPAGCFVDGSADLADYESSAKQKSLTVSGHKVYALFTNAREGYRNNATTGVPMGNLPQGIYELADGTHAGTACCWDFGNVGKDNCNGTTMDTLFFGTGFWGRGAGSGPWFMGDFEGGVWSGGNVGAPTAANDTTAANPSMAGVPFAFGIVKTSSGQYALRMGNGTSGTLTTAYDGASPKQWNGGGGLVLGVGGDNSNHSFGTFFEGALTMGRPSDATDAAVLANVQAAGYGK